MSTTAILNIYYIFISQQLQVVNIFATYNLLYVFRFFYPFDNQLLNFQYSSKSKVGKSLQRLCAFRFYKYLRKQNRILVSEFSCLPIPIYNQ